MIPKEIEGRVPDKVITSESGRRIELYGVPTEKQMVNVLYNLIKPKLEAEVRKKCAKS